MIMNLWQLGLARRLVNGDRPQFARLQLCVHVHVFLGVESPCGLQLTWLRVMATRAFVIVSL